jgi:DNA repair protein RecO (recombination protein O)
VDRFTYDEGSDSTGIFQLLIDTLSRLASGADPWMATRYYEMRLLDHLGFRPKLFECAMCGREIQPEDQFFSYVAGGVVCPASAQEEQIKRSDRQALRPISVEALKYLRHFQRSNAAATRARTTPEVQRTEA